MGAWSAPIDSSMQLQRQHQHSKQYCVQQESSRAPQQQAAEQSRQQLQAGTKCCCSLLLQFKLLTMDSCVVGTCRHVKIGNPLEKGISGGQAKRTNIGIALITSPRVLFLDEPTSGLDSFTANEVMTVVQGLAADRVTILATIHSPTAYAFSLFDSLMMLVSCTQHLWCATCKHSTLLC